MPGEILLASKQDHPSIDRVFDRPVQPSATTLEYTTEDSHGTELRPQHVLEFEIPESMQGRIVRDVVLQHRKAEKYRVGTEKHDPAGAYSRVELHDSLTGEWKQWKDPAGYNSDKYAEWRSAGDPEHEVLHDWIATVGIIKPDKVRVTNVGNDPEMSVSQVHQLDVVFFPELENVEYQEKIYTPGTQFTDFDSGRMLPSYGGGEHTRGIYEQAAQLNGHGASKFELNKDPGMGVEVSHGHMLIDLKPSQKLTQFEVSIGDTEHLENASGEFGKDIRLGWAKLWVGIQRAETGQIEWFIKRANVPPQGVIAGGPDLEHAVIQEGDKLIIESRNDTSYIMGWRIAYEKTHKTEASEDAKPKRKLNLNLKTLFRQKNI